MSIVADFTVPAKSFALSQALTAEPDMTVEGERQATHSSEWALPFLWASGGDFETFHEAMQDDPTVANVTVIEESDDSILYQIEWSDEIINIIDEIINQHASILRAKGHGETWRLHLRFAEDKHVSSFQKHFSKQGRTFTVNKLSRPTAPRQREHGLTATQRDTLATALHEGYFNVPRDLTIDELADILGISSNAASQRIRRASASLIQDTIVISAGESNDEE